MGVEASTPVKAALPAGVRYTKVAGGAEAGLALDESGHAWTFGGNQVGELGTGQDINALPVTLTPVRVNMPAATRWSGIGAGSTSTTFLAFVAAKPAARPSDLSTIAADLMSPSHALATPSARS